MPHNALPQTADIMKLRPAATALRPHIAMPSDLSTKCPTCLVEMIPVHSHYQCPRCGMRDSCCF
jgi:Zn finger protein HypA/HybF involved in hydrogenase expression